MMNETYNFENSKKDFLDACKEGNYPDKDVKEFVRIINYSKERLQNKKRISGYPSIVHNIKIATWIAKSKLGIRTIKAALLYETARMVDILEIEKEFGEEIAKILKENNKLSIITKKKKEDQHANLSNMIIVSLKDIRVLFIKLAAKLENLNTINALSIKEQKRIAKDVIEFYSPLALRMGLEKIRREFEDRAFKILNPKKYEEISQYLKINQKEHEDFLNNIVKEMYTKINNKVKLVSIKNRVKHIYSIYNKFKRDESLNKSGKKKLSEQTDYYGIRIITKNKIDCFKVAEILRDNYKIIEVKDYITNKKANNYQAIHLICEINSKNVEIQIRTEEMEWIAEYGSASHKAYKGISTMNDVDKKINWLRDIFEFQVDSRSSETLKKLSFDLFNDSIFCFTPKDDIIKLPINSTLLDFAFYVHDNLGFHCIGGIVDDDFKNINYVLNNGDVVEVITHEKQHPKESWLICCNTKKSKTKLKKYFTSKELKFNEEKKGIALKNYDYLFENAFENNTHFLLGRCCNPLPGDQIIGIKKSNEITVHKNNCVKYRLTKNINISWKKEINKEIRLVINSKDRVGLLSDLLLEIKEFGEYILNAKGKVVNDTNAKCIFEIKPIKLEILSEMIKKIKCVKGVTSVKIE